MSIGRFNRTFMELKQQTAEQVSAAITGLIVPLWN